MIVQCPACGKTERITIGSKCYCADCGTLVDSNTTAAANSAYVSNHTKMVDIAAKPAQSASALHQRPAAIVDTNQVSSAPANNRAVKAASIPQSNLISRFLHPNHSPAPQPAVAANPTSPAIRPVVEKITPAPAALPSLPNQVVTQLDAMNRIVNSPLPPPSQSDPKPTNIAAAVLSVMIMSGFIWFQNAPKLAVRSAANRAGFAASLPGYVPSSYSLGPIQYGSGQIVLNFNTSSEAGPLTLTERPTSWDSSSLLDNFVTHKSDKYVAVEGQGLTIYLYGGNQASWVNHGIWYDIAGSYKLSREQILKMAYSL